MFKRLFPCLILLQICHANAAGGGSEYQTADVQWSRLQSGINARETWARNRIDSYVYVLDMQCYCALPKSAKVFVINGRVERVQGTESNEVYIDPVVLSQYKTIPEYFELIDELYRKNPDSLTIEHNRYLGYPELVQADISYKMADEEISYKLTNFQLLKKK